MSTTRNKYGEAHQRLIETGLKSVRRDGFGPAGINQILKDANVPRGSFYHHFDSKEAFGLALLDAYHDDQMAFARQHLSAPATTPADRLRSFFAAATQEFAARDYADGCLMCNLSTELGDTHETFQRRLDVCWQELSGEIRSCIEEMSPPLPPLAHLTPEEAADWLLNAWAGALTRMKAERSRAPLDLFMKSVFGAKQHE